MPQVRAGENEIFYAGGAATGPALVLIHGAGGNHLVWPAALRRLAGATVYALDLPGHGRSTGEGRETISEYAADVVRFLDEIEEESAILVGHSMGGAVAQVAALTYPDRVAKLVLISTGAHLPVSDALLELLAQNPGRAVKLIEKWAWGPEAAPDMVARGTEFMLETDPSVLRGDFVACNRFDIRDQVAQIAAPALILAGSDDKMTPPEMGQWLAREMPAARFHSIPGAGHMVMLEKPSAVVEQTEVFLGEAIL